MGSGKSTVGKILADALGLAFVDLDEEIVREEGRSIPEIFTSVGEAGFREIEFRVLKKVLGSRGAFILALGGGTVTLPRSAVLVREKTLCIWLQASPEELWARLRDEASGRPLLSGMDSQGKSTGLPSSGSDLPNGDSSHPDGSPDPLLTHIRTLLEVRSDAYAAAAAITLPTDGLSPSQIADEIIISCL